MSKTNTSGMPLLSTRLTATVSVTLVLLLLGVAAALGLAASSVADDIRSGMGFTVILSDDASESDIASLKQRLARAPYTAGYDFATADKVLERWQAMAGDENVTDVLDQNPFAPEIEVRVRPRWADSDSIASIAGAIEMLPCVSDVKTHSEIVDDVNSTVRTIATVLAIVALTLTVISFVLISNTVRLTIYARRFSIHTMRLVGATPGFIRAPIVRSNVIDGLVSGLLADALLAGALAYIHSVDPSSALLIGWEKAAWVLATLPPAGMLICLLSSLIATNRYIRLSHDDMFR